MLNSFRELAPLGQCFFFFISMASVCGGCLALLDAGVPLKTWIAGIAMGLVLNTEEVGGDGQPLILTDISGSEDASGDMDLKVVPPILLLCFVLKLCGQICFFFSSSTLLYFIQHKYCIMMFTGDSQVGLF